MCQGRHSSDSHTRLASRVLGATAVMGQVGVPSGPALLDAGPCGCQSGARLRAGHLGRLVGLPGCFVNRGPPCSARCHPAAADRLAYFLPQKGHGHGHRAKVRGPFLGPARLGSTLSWVPCGCSVAASLPECSSLLPVDRRLAVADPPLPSLPAPEGSTWLLRCEAVWQNPHCVPGSPLQGLAPGPALRLRRRRRGVGPVNTRRPILPTFTHWGCVFFFYQDKIHIT